MALVFSGRTAPVDGPHRSQRNQPQARNNQASGSREERSRVCEHCNQRQPISNFNIYHYGLSIKCKKCLCSQQARRENSKKRKREREEPGPICYEFYYYHETPSTQQSLSNTLTISRTHPYEPASYDPSIVIMIIAFAAQLSITPSPRMTKVELRAQVTAPLRASFIVTMPITGESPTYEDNWGPPDLSLDWVPQELMANGDQTMDLTIDWEAIANETFDWVLPPPSETSEVEENPEVHQSPREVVINV
ncbi:hypothetical protein F5Y18DRAFT_439673 [Xylariaceae sp. FL1019]|nr:hypothetical protein F5Y18DRAFT_439673 [Xylariaceae sp. FL1019]